MIFFLCTTYLFCFLLDTANLFATENASGMRYRKETMLFWIFGLLNFQGKWIRFCRDEKFSGTVLEGKERKEYFNPQLNKPRINFAVPSDKIKKKNCVEKECKSTLFLEAWSYPLPFGLQMKQK